MGSDIAGDVRLNGRVLFCILDVTNLVVGNGSRFEARKHDEYI